MLAGSPSLYAAGWPVVGGDVHGQHPVEELAARMAGPLGVTGTAVRADLLAAPESISLLWRQLVASQDEARVLVVVDQFEEIFTLCGDPEERHAFVSCLVASATELDDQVTIVLRLVALGQGTEVTRRRVTRAELHGGENEPAVTDLLTPDWSGS